MKAGLSTSAIASKLFLPAALFLLCFSFYLTRLTPIFMDDDSPETLTAAASLGLQHPPGYALLALSQRLGCLLPLGNIAFRINLGSACLGALNVVLVAWICLGLLRLLFPAPSGRGTVFPAWVCSLTAALTTAFSRTFWEKSLGAKGFLYLGSSTLGLLMVLCLLNHLEEMRPQGVGKPSDRWLLMAFFIFGLGFGWHWETHLLFFPILLAFGFPSFGGISLKNLGFNPMVRGAALILTGGSTLLYLPIRARLHPVLDLGAPVNFRLFLADFFRSYTSEHDLGVVSTMAGVLRHTIPWARFTQLIQTILDIQGRSILSHLEQESGGAVILLALLGILFWVQAKEYLALLALITPMILLVSALCSASWIPRCDLSSWYVDNFLLPLNWGFALMAGVGLFGLGTWWSHWGEPSRRGPWLGACLALVALPLPALLSNRPLLDFSRQVLRYDYGVNLMKSLPTNSVFFAEADEDYFTFYYLQLVEKKRPDITMIPAFTLFETWGVEQVERFHPDLGLDLRPENFPDHFSRIQAANREIVGKNLNRVPLGYSYFDGAFHRQYLNLRPNSKAIQSGIVYLLDSPLSRQAPLTPLSTLRLRHLFDCPSDTHPCLSGIRAVYGLVFR